MALISWDDTLACLDVYALGDALYTGPNIAMPYRRIFGGQLLAQLVAVAETVSADKQVKSLHVVFPREGDLAEPAHFSVDVLQSGRSFASQAIRVHQGETVIAQATVSLHAPEEGPLRHQVPHAPTAGSDDAVPVELSMIPWETRVVGGIDLESRATGPSEFTFLMRTPPFEAGAFAHRALLAHATDLTLIGTALRPHDGVSEIDSPERIQTAVTSHSIWFHDTLRVDDWLALTQTSPVVSGGRGFGRGDVFDPSGRLVASYAQESLIRVVD